MSLHQVAFVSQTEDFHPVGERVKTLRGALTQAAFAERLGINRKTVVRWEGGEALPDGPSLLALQREFGADPAWLLVGERASVPVLTVDEQRLLALYRLADAAVRKAVIGALATGEPPAAPPVPAPATAPQPKRVRRAGAEVVIHGGVSQHIEGGSHPGATFHVDMRSGTTKK